MQLTKTKRWKTLYVSHLFSVGFIPHPLVGNTKTHIDIWNGARCTDGNKKWNLRWLHKSHSHWGSCGSDWWLLPQPFSRSIHGIRPLHCFFSLLPTAPFFYQKSVHNRYVIIFHLLALFNTLITISPAWAKRKLLPPLNMNLFYFRLCVRTSLNSCEGKCPCLFSISPLKSVWLLSLLVLKSWGIIAWWCLYRFSLCCAL